uniref:Uncharacterized protein n=1 Tax=Romanomermis culicivorax TaxID=13658 RepID=A0A915HQV7_ROMCU
MIHSICILSLVAAYAYAETCDLQALQQCVKNNLGVPALKAESDQRKTTFEGCLTTNGCKLPQPKVKEGGNFQAVQTCRKNILDKVKSDVEKCVQKSNPNFKFPPPPKGDEHHGDGGPPPMRFGEAKGKGGMFDRIVNDSCPSDQAKLKAKACLQAAMASQGTRPPKPAPGSSEMKQKICQAKAVCFAKISPTCQKSFNDTKDALCKCAKDIVTPQQAVQLQTSLKACNPNEGKFTRPPGAPTKGPEMPADRFIKKFCEMKC